MEDELAADYYQIEDELFNAADEVIISRYLKRMVVNGDSWPDHFIQDVDVFNKNPNVEFQAERPTFVIVKPRTKSCGKTDGCEAGCWRIIGRDKLIKSEETGKILGFKKILKFCLERKPREYKRCWVMEEYRVANNLNWKQDHVVCKIRFLFQTELSFLLTKHFSYLSTTRSVPPVPLNLLLPAYGFHSSADPQEDDESYMYTILDSDGNHWPSYVTNNVYRLHPATLVDPFDQMFRQYGICIFANETCGTTDECYGGYWRILHRDRLIKSKSGKTMGFKKVFKFYEAGKQTQIMTKFNALSDHKRRQHACDLYDLPDLSGLSGDELRILLSQLNSQLDGLKQHKMGLVRRNSKKPKPKTMGFKKGFKFSEMEKQSYVREGEDVKVTWIIEEYRVIEKVKQNKVLCVIKFTQDN